MVALSQLQHSSFAPQASTGASVLTGDNRYASQSQSTDTSHSFAQTLSDLQSESSQLEASPTPTAAPAQMFQSDTGTSLFLTNTANSTSSTQPSSYWNSNSSSKPADNAAAPADSAAANDQQSGTTTASASAASSDSSSSAASQPATSSTDEKGTTTTPREPNAKHSRKAGAPGAQAAAVPLGNADSVAPSLLAVSGSANLHDGVGPQTAADPQSNAAGPGSPAQSSGGKITSNSQPAGTLAFAVRVQSEGSVVNSTSGANGAGPISDNFAPQIDPKLAEQLQAVAGAAPAGDPALALAANQPVLDAGYRQAADPGNATQQAAVETSAGSETAAAAETAATETNVGSTPSALPLRSVQVQITGQDSQRIDLKLIERSGSLSISVRAADGGLTRTLQDHLPELTTKLSEQAGQAEWWTPKSGAANLNEGSQHEGNSGKQEDPRSQGQGGSAGQDSRGQQGGRQNNQPDWVDELAAVGNTNTRKEYIWHQ